MDWFVACVSVVSSIIGFVLGTVAHSLVVKDYIKAGVFEYGGVGYKVSPVKGEGGE